MRELTIKNQCEGAIDIRVNCEVDIMSLLQGEDHVALDSHDARALLPILTYYAKHGTLDGYGEQPADTIWVPSVWCSATGSLYELAAYDTLDDKTNTADIALLVRSTPMTVSWLQWKAENKAVCIWPLAGSELVATSEQPANPPDLGKPGVRPTREGEYRWNYPHFGGRTSEIRELHRDGDGCLYHYLHRRRTHDKPITDSFYDNDSWHYLGPLPDAQPESKPEPIEATRVEIKPTFTIHYAGLSYGHYVEVVRPDGASLYLNEHGAIINHARWFSSASKAQTAIDLYHAQQAPETAKSLADDVWMAPVVKVWACAEGHYIDIVFADGMRRYLNDKAEVIGHAHWFKSQDSAQNAVDRYHARQDLSAREPVAWPLNGEWGAVGQRSTIDGDWESELHHPLHTVVRNRILIASGNPSLVSDYGKVTDLLPLTSGCWDHWRWRYRGPLPEPQPDLAARVEALEVKLAELMEGKA